MFLGSVYEFECVKDTYTPLPHQKEDLPVRAYYPHPQERQLCMKQFAFDVITVIKKITVRDLFDPVQLQTEGILR